MTHHSDQVFNTNNYVWSNRDRLGYGATGAVYVGYNKASGERVAVKVFTGGQEFKSLKREIDVVKQLPHQENIVKLFGVEEDRKYRNQVIIMELCTGGSLYEVIDSPENAYGLCETEFKQVIYDVAKGLQHLRHHNFIHRDIKPGNIMRCQQPDGSFVFKLADFGTARELGPNETFFSLHGTEEYLYPGMYERALVNPQKKKNFSAKVDLWSVGATFFHAATGKLPFQPFRKREDRALMFKIISEKPTGVVSGWQTEPNGRIIYSNSLPTDTRLSLGLSLLITEILAGLMENDISKIWEFDEFFKQIEKIHWKKVVDVFCVYSCTCHKVFIDPDYQDGLKQLKEGIQMQTGLPVDYQELFYENLPYQPTQRISASMLPTTTVDRPIMVFGGNSKKSSELTSPMLPTIPSAPHGLALANDVQFAKECAKVIYYFKYQVEEVDRVYRLMHQAALCYGYTVKHEYSLLEQRLTSIDQLNVATCRALSSQVAGLTNIRDTISVVNQATSGSFQAELQSIEQDIMAKKDLCSKVKGTPSNFRDKIEEVKQDSLFTDDLWDSKKGADVFHRSIESMQFMVAMVDKDYKTFQREKKYKSLNAHDQKVHEFTKLRLQQRLSEAQQKVVTLLSARMQVYSSLGDWQLKMIPLRCDVKGIGKWMNEHSSECNRTLQQTDQWEAEHKRRLETVNQKIADLLTLSNRQPKTAAAAQTVEQVEIPRHIWTKLRQSRNELSSAILEQKTKLERLKLISIGSKESVQNATNNSLQKHLTSRNAS